MRCWSDDISAFLLSDVELHSQLGLPTPVSRRPSRCAFFLNQILLLFVFEPLVCLFLLGRAGGGGGGGARCRPSFHNLDVIYACVSVVLCLLLFGGGPGCGTNHELLGRHRRRKSGGGENLRDRRP